MIMMKKEEWRHPLTGEGEQSLGALNRITAWIIVNRRPSVLIACLQSFKNRVVPWQRRARVTSLHAVSTPLYSNTYLHNYFEVDINHQTFQKVLAEWN